MRIILTLFFLVSGLALVSAQAEEKDLTMEKLNALVDSANMIVDGRCSGTLIDAEKRLVLTNFHCVGHKITSVQREVVGADGVIRKVTKQKIEPIQVSQNRYAGHVKVASASYRGKIVGHKKERDLALIEILDVSFPNSLAIRILPEGKDVLRGEPVVAIGNPMMLDASITRGIVSSVTRTFEFPWTNGEELAMLQFTGGITGGSSGGSLIQASTGELIGVPAAGASQATFIGLAIPVSVVRETLREWCYGSTVDRKADDAACRKKQKLKGITIIPNSADKKEDKEVAPDVNAPRNVIIHMGLAR